MGKAKRVEVSWESLNRAVWTLASRAAEEAFTLWRSTGFPYAAHLYFLPQGLDLKVRFDVDPLLPHEPPWELVTDEPLPTNKDRQGLTAWIHDRIGRIALLPTDEKTLAKRAAALKERTMKAREVRSYGPGKFYTILDGYVYAGGADEEESYGDGGGWYGLVGGEGLLKAVLRVAAEEKDTLTADEIAELKATKGVILFERSDGIVESEWFTSKKALEKAWAGIVAEFDEIRAEQGDDW